MIHLLSAAAGFAGAAPCVALVVDRFDWHARELSKALAARGALCVPMRLPACGFATGSASGLRLDGFGERLPDAVVVRTMSGGSFEAESSANTLAGGAKVASCSACSGGQKVGFVGNGGTLTFNGVTASVTGSYQVIRTLRNEAKVKIDNKPPAMPAGAMAT